ncbi:uncharacterized protein ColSpa_08303 [Colletotrichum spaethianum]|uniref:Uncharacterized protein n=1 Tax=Colletotrichum spaethianum TaxID=700344 RepID=A0AA37UQ51_9PEZI|nr:uncharacterized protein ColSpa_08303 [Colletotrichum spaethianum]GKT48122.1 hypothetical protein ColSpa_08303 [Colletotrichum spaethianum]
MCVQMADNSRGQLIGALAAGAAGELSVTATLDDLATDAVTVGQTVYNVRLVLADATAALAALDDIKDVIAHGEDFGVGNES